jgi:two-component system cell cycle sensor histidine kinase/response regulator CckA
MGTTTKIYLPICETRVTNRQSDRTRTGRILLVEDDEGMRNLVVEVLESEGYEITSAVNAEEALKLFRQQGNSFGLLFSDILLPGKNGIELADILRTEKPGLPVLLYSGYQDERVRWTQLDLKKYHFLKKPFPIAGLLAAVHDALTETTP